MVRSIVGAGLGVALSSSAEAGAKGITETNQPAKKPELKEAPGTSAPKNPALAKGTDGEIDKTSTTAGASRIASSGTQNSSQSQQNTNGNPDQSGSVSARIAEGSLPQSPAQTIATPGASHEIATSAPMPEGPAVGSRSTEQGEVPGFNQQEIGEGAATTVINSAKLVQAMGQTEMRVGLHTSDFGDISIRTSGSQQQMLAQISLDHSELSQTIAAHISSVQTKLGDEHGIQASIQINNQGASHSSDSEQQQPSQRQQNAFAGSARSVNAGDHSEADQGINLGMFVPAGNDHRLDIRA
jgi:hypothetical protein